MGKEICILIRDGKAKGINRMPLLEDFETRKIGDVITDTASILIVDPAKLNLYGDDAKMKDFEQDGYISMSLGSDGEYEIFGKFDKDAKYPHIPYEIVIKIRDRSKIVDEGSWGYYPLDNDLAADWKWDFADMIKNELMIRFKGMWVEPVIDQDILNYKYYAIGMWEVFKRKLVSEYEYEYAFFSAEEVTALDLMVYKSAVEILGNMDKLYYDNKDYVRHYLEYKIDQFRHEYGGWKGEPELVFLPDLDIEELKAELGEQAYKWMQNEFNI